MKIQIIIIKKKKISSDMYPSRTKKYINTQIWNHAIFKSAAYL